MRGADQSASIVLRAEQCVRAVGEQVGVRGEEADGVERRRQRDDPVDGDDTVGGPPAVDTAVARRHADGPAGVGAEREVGQPGGHRGG